MSEYIKHTWTDGEVIDANGLNNIETGIAESKKDAETNKVEIDNLTKLISDMMNGDSTMEEIQQMIDYINSNKELIDEITVSKVNVSDIVNDLVTNEAKKPLSAAQGFILKGLIDTLQTAVENAATTAQTNLSDHNTNTEAHADLRLELQALTNRINAALDSDDTTLDELSEIVAYIKSNKALIDAITTSKVSVVDIVDNLTTNVANRPLSAAQGVVLKGLIDTLQTAVNGKAPTSHAASTTTYGAGSGSNYGHVKLSDATNGTSNTSGGVAATPAAVKDAYDLANKANTAANEAKTGLGNLNTEDWTFTLEDGSVTTKAVYVG